MGKADSSTKKFTKNNDVFADIFNFFFFGGKQVINPQELKEMDTSEIVIPYSRDGKNDHVQKYRDVLKSAVIKYDDEATYVLLGIENQTAVHYAAPIKMFLYDIAQYSTQVENIAKEHRKKHDLVAEGEFLSGFNKEDRLIPVITLAIHYSADEWDGPMTLHEMMCTQNPDILKYVPNYRINLVSPATMSDEDFAKLQTTMREVLMIAKASKDKDKMRDAVKAEGFRDLGREEVDVINDCFGTKLRLQKGRRLSMCKAFDDLKAEALSEGRAEGLAKGLNEGRTKGRAEGRAEGRNEGKLLMAIEAAKKMLQKGSSVEDIRDIFPNLTEEQIEALQ